MKATAQAVDSGIEIISSSSFLSYRGGNARPFLNSPFKGYNVLSKVTSNLRQFSSGTSLEIFGYLVDSNGETLPNTGIEIWHLTPSSDEYNNRAVSYTNSSGFYKFITNLPEREKGKNYEVYFRVEKDKRAYYTKLIFNNITAILSNKYMLNRPRPDFECSINYDQDLKNDFVFQFDIALCPDQKS